MKKTKVSLGHSLPIIPLSRLERLVIELKSLSKKRIKHDPRTLGLLEGGRPTERVIYVRFPQNPNKPFEYVVKEYGDMLSGGTVHRHTFLSVDKYTSSDLKRRY